MSKGLEALEKLRQNNVDNSHLFDDELLDTIEKEINQLLKENLVLSIKEKAFEIIKKKFDINVYIMYTKGDYQLNITNLGSFVDEIYEKISKEEFDILKEVLA